MTGEAIVERARACVGARFRPQGRDPLLGLDCVGLVLFALGPDVARARPTYALSGERSADRAESGLRALGGEQVDRSSMGDIVLFEPVASQAHLAVASENGIIQAHLGVRRVVEGPADPAWAVRSIWRFGVGE